MNQPVTDAELARARKETGWSETRVRVLAALWNAGSSAAECASALGNVTRNAIIGKIDRAGLTRPGRPQPKPRSVPARSPRSVPARLSRIRNHGPTPKRVEPPPPKINDLVIPEIQRRSIMRLTSDCCRWPVGDPFDPGFFFCGAVVHESGPYCAGHHARAVEPRAGRRSSR